MLGSFGAGAGEPSPSGARACGVIRCGASMTVGGTSDARAPALVLVFSVSGTGVIRLRSFSPPVAADVDITGGAAGAVAATAMGVMRRLLMLVLLVLVGLLGLGLGVVVVGSLAVASLATRGGDAARGAAAASFEALAVSTSGYNCYPEPRPGPRFKARRTERVLFSTVR